MSTKIRFGMLLFAVVLLQGFVSLGQPITAAEVIDLVNRDRAQHGLDALNLNPKLSLAAFAKASDMIEKNYFSHTSPEGVSPWDWLKSLGYNYAYAGENLATGFNDSVELEKSWMSSPTHRANILSPFYSEVGMAVVNYGDTTVVVQMFGSETSLLTLRQ